MSDHLHIQLNIEIYNQSAMQFDRRSDILSNALKGCCEDLIYEFGFPEDAFFVSVIVM